MMEIFLREEVAGIVRILFFGSGRQGIAGIIIIGVTGRLADFLLGK